MRVISLEMTDVPIDPSEAVTNTKTRIRTSASRASANRSTSLVVVLENPSSPINVGTVMRNADAYGVRALYVIQPPESKLAMPTWPESRKMVKNPLAAPSVSANCWVYTKKFASTAECVDYLRDRRYTSYGTSPHRQDKPSWNLFDGDYTAPRLALWFGNETNGLTNKAVSSCDGCVAIPMLGFVESLNLATSTGVVLSEVVRQRHAYCAAKKKNQTLSREGVK